MLQYSVKMKRRESNIVTNRPVRSIIFDPLEEDAYVEFEMH